MAAPPITRSGVSWNPEVPPPPVSGAASGVRRSWLGFADGRADAVWLGFGLGEPLLLGEADGDAERLLLGEADGDAERLLLAEADGDAERLLLGEAEGDLEPLLPGEADPLALDDAEALTLGDRLGGVADGEDPEQPATAADASIARVAKPAAPSPALILVRALAMAMSRKSPRRRGRPGTSVRKGRRSW
jgi:hypothetical protein